MPSPLPSYLPSSHTSSTSLSHRAQQHRKTSNDKPGLMKRNSSTSSLHRSTSSKSNASAGATKPGKHHPPHVAHTSASKHHRATSFGHRVPSYGKGLNKLTALTTVHTDEAPKGHLSVHSIVDRAQGGSSMQRSLSEGSTLMNKDRRQSGSSVHASRPRVRRPTSSTSTKQNKQHVTFSTNHSSDEEDEVELGVHRKSDEIVASPLSHTALHRQGTPQQHHHISPAPPSMIHRPGPQKSALKEALSSSAPKFLQKNLSQVGLVPPKVSITNAVSRDLAKQATSVEHIYSDNGTPSSEPQVPPSSNPTSHFISSTPPSRTPRTPDLDMTGLRRNQSSTSLAPTDQILPMSSTSGKLTRTQQKLLLQRASTQPQQGPLNLTTSYSSPSLAQVQYMESAPDYFSPMPTTPTFVAPGQSNMTYDVKVAREFDRISRELINAKRFGDPTGDAIRRLQDRINPSKNSLAKKQSAFGLSMAWKRSPDKHEGGRTRVDHGELFEGERKSKVREIMRRLWFDEVDVQDVSGERDDEGDEGDEQVTLKGSRRREGARSQ